jgi:transposase-like protein
MSFAFDITDPIFHDEAKATAHMEADRWPDGVYCPLCGCDKVHKMGGKTQTGMFVCYGCAQKFTVRTGTVFERSHIPLHKWLLATRIMAASKKNVSALQLQLMLGLGSYRTAWFMCHRIREAMKPAKPDPIGGKNKVVEWDFKFNTRKLTDGERAALALKGAEGKRLTYRQPRKAAHT